VNPLFVEPELHGWLAPFALVGMTGGMSLFWAGAAYLAHRLAPVVPKGAGWLLWPITLMAAELLRGWIFTGFPWGGPGLIWIDVAVGQLAAWIGVSGLGFLTMLFACVLVAVLTSKRPIRNGAFLIVAIICAGVACLILDARQLPTDTDIRLRLVQPNAPQHLKWHPDHAYSFVERQIALTAAPPKGDTPYPDLVIWPETAVPTLLSWTGDILDMMAEAGQGRPILFGVQRDEHPRYFNSIALLRPDATIGATYDKHHLVPFGEYIPFGDALAKFGITAFASEAGQSYSAGPSAQVMDLGALGKVLPLICYEAVFPSDLHAAPERADWILNVTNDAWFGTFAMPQQHLVQARFRAIEFGLPMVRVANTGISAVIDAKGGLQKVIDLGQEGFLDADLPSALAPTIYARFGDLPLILCLSVLMAGLVVRRDSFSR